MFKRYTNWLKEQNRLSVRLTNILFLSQSLASATQSAIFTLLVVMASQLSGSDTWAGLPSTFMTLAIAFAALPSSHFMARFGRRMGLTLSYLLSCLGAFFGVIAITQGWFLMLLLSSAFIGLGRAGTEQSRYIPGELFPESERARMIGRVVFAGVAGAVSGPLFVTPLKSITAYLQLNEDVGPWLMGVVFYLLAAILIFAFLRPDPLEVARVLDSDKKKNKNEEAPAGRSVKELLRLPAVQLAVLSMLISQATMVSMMGMVSLHMNHLGHDSTAFSYVISAHVFGMYGLAALTGYLIDRFGRVAMMVAGALSLMFAAIIAPLSASLWLLLPALFLVGLGWSFGYVAGSALLVDVIKPEERSKIQGTSEILVSGTAAIAAFVAGIIFNFGSYAAVAAMGVILTLLFVWLVRLLAPKELETQTA